MGFDAKTKECGAQVALLSSSKTLPVDALYRVGNRGLG